MILATIPNEEANVIGMDSYYEMETVYNSLVDLLSNNSLASNIDIIEELQKHSAEKPYLSFVINDILDFW